MMMSKKTLRADHIWGSGGAVDPQGAARDVLKCNRSNHNRAAIKLQRRVGDYFGNGTDDILFRNNSTGDTWLEAISNGASAGWHQVGGSNTGYTVKS